MAEKKSAGQALLERIAAWIGGYVAHPDPNVPMILGLWSLHTWFTERFEATPRLTITGAPGTGKSRMGECVAFLARGTDGKLTTDITPAAYFTKMTNAGCKRTFVVDEAEAMQSGAANLMRKVLNSGYRQGATVDRKLPNGDVTDFVCYGPMACIAVGEPTPTLRTRSIIVLSAPGTPARQWFRTNALAEAETLKAEMKTGGVWVSRPVSRYPDHLKERDQEIWAALFGTADALALDADTMKRIVRFSKDNATYKEQVAARRYQVVEAATKDEDREYRQDALRDMKLAVSGLTAKRIHTEDLIERMKALDAGPWRVFRGVGLDALSLSALVEPYGIKPKLGMIGKRPDGSKNIVRGYDVDQIRKLDLSKLKPITDSEAPNTGTEGE